MYHMIYDYPRNKQLLEKSHQLQMDSNGNWEPQGSLLPRQYKRGGKNTYIKDGKEYYFPVSIGDNTITPGMSKYSRRGGKSTQHPYGSLQMYDMNADGLEGGFGLSDVKRVAKKGATLAFDQIPKATSALGATVGTALPTALGFPGVVPLTSFVGKKAGEELGKLARKKIKQKTGLGKCCKYVKEYTGGALEFKIEKMPKRPTTKKYGGAVSGGKRKPSQWIQEVKAYQEKNPNLTYKQAMIELSKRKKK